MTALNPKKALKERPPIIVVMGHVDHGKTTLVDAIRQLKVSEKEKPTTEEEAGGITQHIGAYEIEHDDKKITFIDTPGHEAFFSMRSRGSAVADIALLVVAADDGVKPQTEEVIKHIKKAEMPFIIAINKIDKPEASSDRVKNELAQHEILVEGRGGQVPVIETSATAKKGIDELLETINLVAELEELEFDAVAQAEGYVLESHCDPKRGISTSIVLTDGTLRTGDVLVCGSAYGKVKIIENHKREKIKGAVPSMPLNVIGVSGTSVAGDFCKVVSTEGEAEKLITEEKKKTEERLAKLQIVSDGQEKFLSIILKADFQGSLEALIDMLKKIKSDRIGLKIVKYEVGDVCEDDIKFAEASDAKIFAFRASINKDVKNYADQKKISINNYEIIYELIEDVKKEMSHLLEAELEREDIGNLKVLAIFRTEPNRMIVGGKVNSGKIEKGDKIEVVRDEESIGFSKVVGLQIGEDKKDLVREGSEAGVLLEGKTRVKEGDTLIAFKEEKIYPEL